MSHNAKIALFSELLLIPPSYLFPPWKIVCLHAHHSDHITHHNNTQNSIPTPNTSQPQELSPDLQTLYVTDTGAQHQTPNATRPATIYAFNISADHKTLSNRRTFAYADTGFPDGIHADNTGNVWAGCGDGVHVWNPQGKLLGKVFIGETSNNFAFGPDGNMWVFSNERMWEVRGLRVVGREVCKDWYGLDSCGIPGSGAPK